jgi:hypothetical protein
MIRNAPLTDDSLDFPRDFDGEQCRDRWCSLDHDEMIVNDEWDAAMGEEEATVRCFSEVRRNRPLGPSRCALTHLVLAFQSNQLKEKANESLRAGLYEAAVNQYSAAISRLANFLNVEPSTVSKAPPSFTDKFGLLHANRSQAFLKIKKFQDALSDADVVSV